MNKRLGILASAVLALAATSASAGIIDFEDLGVAVGTQLNPAAGVSQATGGFIVSPGPINTSGLNDLHFHNMDGLGNNGSTVLGTHDDVVITQSGGGAFDVFSFDFEGFQNESDIRVVGSLSGGGTVSQTFTADGNPSTYETFLLSGFTGLSSISFEYLGNGATGFFLDNINTGGGHVPEPGGLGLVALGLAAAAAARSRQRPQS